MIQFEIKLKSGKEKDALAILVAYSKTFAGHRFVYSTGIKVARKGFNAAKPGKVLKTIQGIVENAYQSILDDGSPLNNISLKSRIDLFRSRVRLSESELEVYDGKKQHSFSIPEDVDRVTLLAEVKQELTKASPNPAKVVNAITSEGASELFGFWKAVLDGKIKPRSGKALRSTTVATKLQTYHTVKEFRPTATFASMDRKFYNAFMAWMSEVVKKKFKKKHADGKIEEVTKWMPRFDDNTQGKHVKELKSILHLASANELIADSRFSYWPVTKLSNEVVALSKDDLQKIIDLELSGTIAHVRDIFVIACFCGARISDFKQFTKQNINVEAGITYISFVAQKTGKPLRVPVHPIAAKIIEKHGGDFPKMIAEQNFREYVKTIAQKAELFDRVVIKIREGSPEYAHRWEAISPHSARRTFASSLFYGWFGKPMPASFCMRYTGHKTEKSFLLYIGASEKELEKKALEYFDYQPQLKVV